MAQKNQVMYNKEEVLSLLGEFKSVENFENKPNQFRIIFKNGEIFQSYKSVIVVEFHANDVYYLGCDWDYSKTTSRYRNKFLGKTSQEIKEDIKNEKAFILEELR